MHEILYRGTIYKRLYSGATEESAAARGIEIDTAPVSNSFWCVILWFLCTRFHAFVFRQYSPSYFW